MLRRRARDRGRVELSKGSGNLADIVRLIQGDGRGRHRNLDADHEGRGAEVLELVGSGHALGEGLDDRIGRGDMKYIVNDDGEQGKEICSAPEVDAWVRETLRVMELGEHRLEVIIEQSGRLLETWEQALQEQSGQSAAEAEAEGGGTTVLAAWEGEAEGTPEWAASAG